MKLLKNNFFKRIIVILSIFIMLTFFAVSPVEGAGIKTQLGEGEFIYSGTTQGSYTPSQSVFDWLVELLKEIVDFLLGLFTMGGRMVFVGWTALFEELITWTLEASVGVPMDVGGNVSATSTDGLISSSNNVTIEAIVYNQVPALNINLFQNPKSSCVSGTGKFFVICETCYNAQNPVVEEEKPKKNMYAPAETTKIGKNQMICKMEDCTCTECWQTLADGGYLQADSSGNPKLDSEGKPLRTINAVTIVKDSVSKWYYILRLIAIMLMLCALIVVGMKMALSTIASQKALYKRMLVDWIVGMIILFTIHYFMVLVINMNESMVAFIKNTQASMTEVVKKEFKTPNKSNSDIEIGIYQEVRTRAYDPKLTVGTTGMIMYITLVFYTIKFVFVYFRRYMSVIILTLLAPGVAFSYAIQKVLTGKSSGFSGWMHEYFTTVFIQTVHALVYTVFVSTALLISLDSIAGMILAFVFLSFMLKADIIFRKIFRLSGNATEEAMNAANDAKNLLGNAKSGAAFMTAGGLLTKSPITKAAMAPLKAARTGAILAAANIASKVKEKNNDKSSDISNESNSDDKKLKNYDDINNKKVENLDDVVEALQRMRGEMTPGVGPNKDFGNFLNAYSAKHGVNYDGEKAIAKELEELSKIAASGNATEEQIEELEKLSKAYGRIVDPTWGDIAKKQLSKLLDMDNYYEYDPKTGKRKLKYGIFGKRRFDRAQNRWVRDTMDDLVAERLKLQNLLGFSDDDKQLLKDVTGLYKSTLIGMGSLFVGLGTIATSPAVGLGLLATGTNNMLKFADEAGVFDPSRTYRKPTVDEKNKRFSFNRFSRGARQNITQSILENAEHEKNAMVVENVRKNHKALYRSLKLGGAGLIAVGAVGLGSVALAPGIVAAGVVANTAGKAIKYTAGYSQRSFLGRVDKNYFKQYEAKRKELLHEDIKMLVDEEATEMATYYDQLKDSIDNAFSVNNEVEKENEELALETGNAIKLESGETLILSKPELEFTSKDIKDSSVIKIIDEAVAETIINKALSQEELVSFSSDDIQKDVKAIVEEKLVAYGVIEKGELDSKIKGVEKQIDRSAKIMVEKELKGADSTDEMSSFDKALVKSVIEEQVSSGEIESTADISTEKIMGSVKEKRKKIIGKDSSSDVIQGLEKLKNSEKTETKQQDFKAKVELSKGKEQSIRSGIIEIKSQNKPRPKNETERKEEKKKRIEALDELLSDYAEGKDEFKAPNGSETYKSADDVIMELFENTGDQNKAKMALENIDNMIMLNQRGENSKMKSKNSKYHNAKNKEKRKKDGSMEFADGDRSRDGSAQFANGDTSKDGSAQFANGDTSRDGSMKYTGGDGRKDISKDVYGPATDITAILENLKNRK